MIKLTRIIGLYIHVRVITASLLNGESQIGQKKSQIGF